MGEGEERVIEEGGRYQEGRKYVVVVADIFS